ncbi:hypothetical protein ACZ91_70015 [Streptomyces regensis]|nr:hypothetical protein ACZ91_70015 [Streptomyces regensis]
MGSTTASGSTAARTRVSLTASAEVNAPRTSSAVAGPKLNGRQVPSTSSSNGASSSAWRARTSASVASEVGRTGESTDSR